MAELIAHNDEQINTVFQLLGNKENDITCAIAWILKKCPAFLSAFIHSLNKSLRVSDETFILYQQFEKNW